MPTKTTSPAARDPRVDDYIARAAPFAQAPLAFVREAMHAALPDVTEAIKWSHPFFLLDARLFANMAAFKPHCSLGFWRGGRPIAEEAAGEREKAMGQFGRIESQADLPKAPALRQLIVAARAAAGIRGLDRGGQARGHAGVAHRAGDRMDRPGQDAQLEVPGLLSAEAP